MPPTESDEKGKNQMKYESLLELVKQRRTIRKFKPDPVPDDYIDKIIEVARWAPSGFNTQPWEFIVIKNRELKDKLARISAEYREQYGARLESTREPWLKPLKLPGAYGPMDWNTAPVFIMLCGDTRAKIGLPMTVRNDPWECQSIFTASLAGAFVYMHLAATSLGLATNWVSALKATLVHRMVKQVLGLPEELEIYDMMAVGYPAMKPREKLMRGKNTMVHYDYSPPDSFRTEEEVIEYAKKAMTWMCATIRRKSD
jgi:nitroreductase